MQCHPFVCNRFLSLNNKCYLERAQPQLNMASPVRKRGQLQQIHTAKLVKVGSKIMPVRLEARLTENNHTAARNTLIAKQYNGTRMRSVSPSCGIRLVNSTG